MRQNRQTVEGRAPARRGEFGEHGADRLGLLGQQFGQIERERAEAHAERLQDAAFVAAQRVNVFVRPPAIENAELFDELIGDAARQAFQRSVGDRFGESLQGGEPPARLARDKGLEPPRGALARRIMCRIRRRGARAA